MSTNAALAILPIAKPQTNTISIDIEHTNKLLEIASPILLICARITCGHQPYSKQEFPQIINQELATFLDKCKSVAPINCKKLQSLLAYAMLNICNEHKIHINIKDMHYQYKKYLSLLEELVDSCDIMAIELEFMHTCHRLCFGNQAIDMAKKIHHKLKMKTGVYSRSMYVNQNTLQLVGNQPRTTNASPKKMLTYFVSLTMAIVLVSGHYTLMDDIHHMHKLISSNIELIKHFI